MPGARTSPPELRPIAEHPDVIGAWNDVVTIRRRLTEIEEELSRPRGEGARPDRAALLERGEVSMRNREALAAARRELLALEREAVDAHREAAGRAAVELRDAIRPAIEELRSRAARPLLALAALEHDAVALSRAMRAAGLSDSAPEHGVAHAITNLLARARASGLLPAR